MTTSKLQIGFHANSKSIEVHECDSTLWIPSYPAPPPRKKKNENQKDLDKKDKIIKVDQQINRDQKTISRKLKSFLKDFPSSASVKLKLGFYNLV